MVKSHGVIIQFDDTPGPVRAPTQGQCERPGPCQSTGPWSTPDELARRNPEPTPVRIWSGNGQ